MQHTEKHRRKCQFAQEHLEVRVLTHNEPLPLHMERKKQQWVRYSANGAADCVL
jgi:hypothetical protein